VAIYPPNIAQYSERMMMAGLVDAKDATGKPYQPPWDYYGSAQVRKHLHVMNGLMQHLWDLDGKPITFPTQESVQKLLRPEVFLFHRVKDSSLIERLRERNLGAQVPDVAPIVTVDTVHGLTAPKVELFIVTHWKDYEWLSYCLRSYKKFATGFSGVTVACPDTRNGDIVKLCEKHGATLKLLSEPKGKGHLAQNLAKCNADKYCTNADFICHIDSDCVFTDPVTPDVLFHNGKPLLLCRTYDSLASDVGHSANARLWQPGVQDALGFKPQWETMAALPIVHPRWIYSKMRTAVEANTRKEFKTYVYGCKPDWPYGFCEFNTIGAFALANHADAYASHETTKLGFPDFKFRQMHSHSGIDTVHPLHRITPEETPRKFMEKLLAQTNNIKKTDFGVFVLVDDTHLSRWVEQHRRLDVADEYLKRFNRFIPIGGTVVDAGTSIGDHTMTYSDMVGPTGKVVGFEANHESAECCRLNFTDRPWVKIHNVGLSSKLGNAEMILDPNVGASAIKSGIGPVNLRPLDSYIPEFTRCDFLKVDIEGHEPEMLDGAVEFIKKFAPVILMEVNHGQLARQGFCDKDIYDRLEHLGYSPIPVNAKLSDPQFDVLAIRQ
jgi:FkbM family methyltransferase